MTDGQRLLAVLLIGGGLLAALGAADRDRLTNNPEPPRRWAYGVNEPVADACEGKRQVADDALAGLVATGLIRKDGTGRIQVDEFAWAAIPHDDKVNVAVAAFCRAMGPNGEAVVRLVGWRDGKTKASVVNGHYSD